MDIFVNIINIGLVILLGYDLYWQSRIQIRANYSYWQVVWGLIIVVWIASTGISSWSYAVFLALFTLLNVAGGVSGIGDKRIAATGVYNRFRPYAKFIGVTLTPVSAPNGAEFVVAIFAMAPRRYVRMIFKQPLTTMIGVLQQVLPETVPVTIQKIN
ncbi:hypothetical protein PQ472_01970 [Lacticaseibacillus pabuli]|uniref:DUF1295 domain-containing protein n=1 Tax=Lacticaseibacillus pabuli TaxID=3025672 RepID=A0ABY7WYN4_9LACO|nr:hypothetical protein [Lacticaseibacillus sp. KACC 23028]WDF83035.1 hypothetical protein PQ472_01970 [Lacticaseibacillus sp. KACC 23028]